MLEPARPAHLEEVWEALACDGVNHEPILINHFLKARVIQPAEIQGTAGHLHDLKGLAVLNRSKHAAAATGVHLLANSTSHISRQGRLFVGLRNGLVVWTLHKVLDALGEGCVGKRRNE